MIELKESNFNQIIKENSKLIAVDFWATWCGPCKMLAPILEEISDEMSTSIILGKVNVDENPNLARQNKITNIPTVIIYKNGEIIDKVVGLKSKDEMINLFNKHI